MKRNSTLKSNPEKIKAWRQRSKPMKRGSILKDKSEKIAKKKTKRKSRSLAKLKKELDAVFSKYIRQKYADSNGNVACYTCGKVKHWKQQQNGHFVSRQYLATRWSEDNCRVQCAGCNVFGNGQLLDFEENLKAELGSKRVEELKQERHKILKLDRQWYEEEIRYYKGRIKD